MPRYDLTFTLLEDLHLGTGTGAGGIDDLQTRDRRDYPCLPATHIKGVLRAAADELRAIDPSMSALNRLFGVAGGQRGELQITHANLAPGTPADCLVWGATKIDPTTGTAQKDHLRFIEYVRAGSIFNATADIADEELAIAFLRVLRRCDRFGAGRNRGSGLTQVSCKPIPLEQSNEVVTAPRTLTLRLLLRALDPLCLAATGEPGNIIPSESFIRGQSLLGALAAWGIAHEHTALTDTLLSGSISVGDALPLPRGIPSTKLTDYDVLPIPLTVLTPKPSIPSEGYVADLPWWTQTRNECWLGERGEFDKFDPTAQKPPEKPKRPDAHEYLFRVGTDTRWQRYAPDIGMRLRTRMGDIGTKTDQALFSNEEIAEDTRFLTIAYCTESTTATVLEQTLLDMRASQSRLRIGRGGRPVAIEDWQWCEARAKSPHPDKTLTLVLESDLVARDAALNFETALTPALLARLAGLSATDAVDWQGEPQCEAVTLRGFNAMTGLPRPARIAIRRGSAIRLTGSTLEKLRDALACHPALGEDTHEGLGRFRLDFQVRPDRRDTHDVSLLTQAHEEAPLNPYEILLAEAREMAAKLKGPSRSQWGEFRDRVHAARNPKELIALFERIGSATDKQGGAGWKELDNNKSLHEIRERAEELSRKRAEELSAEPGLARAQFYLDALVRWWRANDTQAQT